MQPSGRPWVDVGNPSDPRLDDYRNLSDPALRETREAGSGLFVAEGRLVVRRLFESDHDTVSVLGTPRALDALGPTDREVPAYRVEQDVLDRVVGFPAHRGLFALGRRQPTAGTDAAAGAETVAVLEDLNDHENLGSIFRSAATLGVGAVLLSPRCADPYYRRCVRVSLGAVLHIPWGVAAHWPGALDDLSRAGYHLVGLTPREPAVDVRVFARDRPRHVALVLGAEGPGLSNGALARCDSRVRIPMADGALDSLNVAVAGAVAFSHLSRLPER
ncbi:MAG TPA: RNA methyltransferase [Acidimicrobiales bacterium]|nr:RNA methyltransferase [Acidimicrobiales bacterium]